MKRRRIGGRNRLRNGSALPFHASLRFSAGILLAGGLLTGCTWIKLTDAGAEVMQGTPESVSDCELVGNVTASTQDRVIVPRSSGKVSEELIVMARNEAPIVGGDTVVPTGPAVDGRQDFEVYRCR